ncbi:MAG TPA: hypothetical protein PLF85_09170 [Turneriella sp.]|nr:hypothetical protein [Turneriella sp.]
MRFPAPAAALALAAFTFQPASPEVFPANQPPVLASDSRLNPLPPEVLAFPEHSENYREKIIAGDYEIWSEERLQRWSSAQGLSVTPDNTAAGLNYHRAAIVSAPGLTFRLRRPVTEKGSEFANGWTLNLDIAAIRARDGQSNLARYQNLLECEVLVDDVLYKTIRQGSHASAVSPVKIPIPHIRSTDGVITVRLRMANHPRNFLFLYDAFLSR